MKKIKLSQNKILIIPVTKEELEKEGESNRHERWLRSLICQDKLPIYLGDEVRISERWMSSKVVNPYTGKTGIVSKIETGSQGEFNIDYLLYQIDTLENSRFRTFHYTLDLIEQTPSNERLARLLRETNKEFERYCGGIKI